jgi:predicted RNA-binding protein associated with RNAse of E/G family
MNKQHGTICFFRPGQTIVLREIWHGKVWSARPYIVVEDTSELTVLCLPACTVIKYPITREGKRVKAENRLHSDWVFSDDQFDCCTLRLAIPGAGYSVLVFWDMPGMKHRSFYINLEDPLYRTAMGFNYLDQWLDAIVKPDLSAWHWKDEDELEEAITLGLISKERAAALYADGEKVARWIKSGNSPFNGWEKWRPDPAWQVPVLPEGWDKVY